MNSVNVWHHFGASRRNVLQILFNTRLKNTSDLVKNNKQLFSKCVFVKDFHTTARWSLQKLCQLKSRGVIQLAGKDTPEFLQGLVTNNVSLLTEKSPSIQYCMMLNVQGRVLYDLFVYNITKAETEPVTFLVDVDASSVDELVKVLKRYKLRKKVDISNVSDIYKVWAEFDVDEEARSKDAAPPSANTFQFQDPRVPTFANRIISDHDSSDSSAARVAETDYREHRYQWGIPEGVEDLPSGKCLPLESNLDFMNGVNFQKGCYIGQELTARTFYTGVIRKRIVPFTINLSGNVEADSTITTQEKGKNAGKLRASDGKHGLCLLRLEHAGDNLEVLSREGLAVSLQVQIPKWWPST